MANPTSSTQVPFVHKFDFSYGICDQLTPYVQRIIANNPGPFTYTGSGTYIITAPLNQVETQGEGKQGEPVGPCAIIDPGPNDIPHINALHDATKERGVSHILITHTHSDHCGGARALSELCGAPIYGFGPHPVEDKMDDAPALDEGADYGFVPDILITDGEIIKGDGFSIEVVATPGHISNHLCFSLLNEKILFTGDHIMGWATTVILPPDGSMSDYFDSLDKLLKRDEHLYLPTHGAPINNPHRFTRAIKAHRHMRDGQIIARLNKGPHTIKEIVNVLYADIDKRLHTAAALNVYAHLIRLCTINTVRCKDPEPALGSLYFIAK